MFPIFLEIPNGCPADLKAEIDREIEIAKARGRDVRTDVPFKAAGGDIVDNDDLLRMLRYFPEHGTMYSRVKDLPE